MRKIGVVVLIIATSATLTFSCKSAPEVAGFEASEWSEDKFGCNGYRQATYQQLVNDMRQRMGFHVNRMNRWLGLPDRTRLYDRGQKFYIYFIEQGGQCPGNKGEEGKAVIFRFSATGNLKEIEVGIPSQ